MQAAPAKNHLPRVFAYARVSLGNAVRAVKTVIEPALAETAETELNVARRRVLCDHNLLAILAKLAGQLKHEEKGRPPSAGGEAH
ncbi:hypothetical protein J2Z19_003970 [Ensifer adhaerens]|uniref:Uncharacterized protein n=1 Tax=Ensifer adhaerens TaxID=106592 RepID=A0ACC5SZE9_ENSAD|nr:hypothetical protein [Ensifer adhaerens]